MSESPIVNTSTISTTLTGSHDLTPSDRVSIFTKLLVDRTTKKLGIYRIKETPTGFDLIVEDSTSNLCHCYYYNKKGDFVSCVSMHGVTPLIGSRELAFADYRKSGDRFLREIIWEYKFKAPAKKKNLSAMISVIATSITGIFVKPATSISQRGSVKLR